ncbi:MAG: Pr6Pr family membrane protein [Pseudomonadota bacterium]
MRFMFGSSHPEFARMLARLGIVLGTVAITGQYIFFQPLFRQMGLGPVSSAFGMLMFLTILTNLMLLAVYWSSLTATPGRISAFFGQTGVRTALAAHIALVAIVYVTAIRGQIALTPPMLVTDALLHYLAPAVYLTWWWQLPDKHVLGYSDVPRWMAWPVVYLCLIMTAGVSTGAFIYPILDVYRLGTDRVVLNIGLILGLLAAIGAALVFVARLQSAKSKAPAR